MNVTIDLQHLPAPVLHHHVGFVTVNFSDGAQSVSLYFDSLTAVVDLAQMLDRLVQQSVKITGEATRRTST